MAAQRRCLTLAPAAASLSSRGARHSDAPRCMLASQRRGAAAAASAQEGHPSKETLAAATAQKAANLLLVGLSAYTAYNSYASLNTRAMFGKDEADVDDARLDTSQLTPVRPRESSLQGAQKLKADIGVNKTLIANRQMVWEAIKETPRIEELDYVPKTHYVESSKEKVLDPIIAQNRVFVVAGSFFGDEGKGKTVDAIARHPAVKVVARVNSGENAGHTVFGPSGQKYAFHLCPSGLLTPGKINYVGPECVMDPVSFMEKEISQLTRDNVDYLDRLFIGNVHIVCPHHKLMDMLAQWSQPNSSSMQGMAPVHASKAKRKGLRMDHLFNDREAARHKLELDLRDYYGAMAALNTNEDELYQVASKNPKIQKHVLDFIKAKDKAQFVFDLYDEYIVNNPKFPRRADVSHLLRTHVKNGEKVLVEGPQSYWLSNAAEKFWSSGTSANTCAAGMMAASRINPQGLDYAVFNIHKSPGSSRVGSGACATSFVPQNYFAEAAALADDMEMLKLDWRDVSEQFWASIQDNGIVKPGIHTNSTGSYDLGVCMASATCLHPSHREFGVTTGKPRVVGFFDAVAHAEVMAAQGPLCSIGALDRGDHYDEYGVCIAYVYAHPEGKSMISNGREFASGTIIRAGEQLPTQELLQFCHPIIKKIQGWKETPIFARGEWWKNQTHPCKLPQAVCEFIDIIEHFTGARVVSIGNGPRGDDIIYIERAE